MNKMLRTAFVSLLIFVSFSSCSTSILRKSIFRRQSDPQYCNAIEGFDCKCSYYRVTCTNDRDLSSPINIIQNEKGKYQSVELVLTAQRDVQVNDRTFEPVKELYKSDGDNLEFRVKFEKFTALHLASPGIFNRVFPENLPSNSKKHLALEIYNPDVPPQDDNELFQNLNVDSLELYALYPFHGTFQQLFNGANIKYLRLSGGDIRSDMSQPFTGNIARLELAKQANTLSVQNFPVYPAHELIINAFYITEFNNENPPNYSNLGELRIHSPDRIPADAFRQFPNIHTLSISTEKDIDPQALNGLTNLEKLTIKDTKPSIDVLNSVPNVKEFETSVEKLDDKTQCQLLEKLANGQVVVVQATPNGRECTCTSAYLDTAMNRTPCDAQNCDQSSCATIKNNYNPSSRTFAAPPTIRRSDGSDASRQREPKVYATPFQVSHQDQEKLQHAIPSQSSSGSNHQEQRPQTQTDDQRQPDVSHNPDDNRPSQDHYATEKTHLDQHHPAISQINTDHESQSYSNDHSQTIEKNTDDRGHSIDYNNQNEQLSEEHSNTDNNHHHTPQQDQSNAENNHRDRPQHQHLNTEDDHHHHKPQQDHSSPHQYKTDRNNENNENDKSQGENRNNNNNDDEEEEDDDVWKEVKSTDSNLDNVQQAERESDVISTTITLRMIDEPSGSDGSRDEQYGNRNDGESTATVGVDGNRSEGEGNENQVNNAGNQANTNTDGNTGEQQTETTGAETPSPAKKGMSWLPIIIIAASIVGLLLIGLIYLLVRKRRANKGYAPPPTAEPATTRA